MASRKCLRGALSLTLALSAAACEGAVESEAEIDSADQIGSTDQGVVQSTNGLRSLNGLSTTNGLRSLNGLSTTNGLRSLNGLSTINGLKTKNGLRSLNGLNVDCTGKTAGVTCTGEPDGLLSAKTGLMASDNGATLASYLVRCALGKNDAVTVKNYKGQLVKMPGELGLTTGWAEGQCDSVCEEKVSACLLAFTNGSGEHVAIEMSAHYKNADGKSGTSDDNVLTIGTGHSVDFPKQEAAFFGNVFASPPQAFYCTQSNALTSIPVLGNVFTVDVRACGGYVDVLGLGVRVYDACPIKSMGSCSEIVMTMSSLMVPHPKCTDKDGAKTKCESGAGTGPMGTVLSMFNNKTWNYPMTTWVR